MSSHRDEHGQPLNRFYRARQNRDRSINELLGVCKGIVADGKVNQEEAEYLCEWLQANRDVRDEWPADILRARIAEYLEDGVLDLDEKEELFDLLRRTAAKSDGIVPANHSTMLPFDSPLPDLIFHGRRFCLTGRFNTGTRGVCARFVESLGGVPIDNPLQAGCVVVVGVIGSRDWVHSTHGRKIEKAVAYRSSGYPVSIIPEYHWYDGLCRELRIS
jgi:hypothetical protein